MAVFRTIALSAAMFTLAQQPARAQLAPRAVPGADGQLPPLDAAAGAGATMAQAAPPIQPVYPARPAAVIDAPPADATATATVPPPPPAETPGLMPGSGGYNGAWQGQWVGAGDQRAYQGTWTGTVAPGAMANAMPGAVPDERWRAMVARCQTSSSRGAVIGGVAGGAVGGLLGNRVAAGNRPLGTVAGAGLGAAAGAAAGAAGDAARQRECDEFFRAYAGPQGRWPYGYTMVPVTVPGPRQVTETTVTREEEVPAAAGVSRHRAIHHRPATRARAHGHRPGVSWAASHRAHHRNRLW